MATSGIKVDTSDHIMQIGLDRADRRNRIDTAMIRGLAAAYTELSTRGDLWCGLVYAEGDDFSFGLDLAEVGPRLVNGGIGEFLADDQVDPWAMVRPRCRKPVVVAVHGRCFTAALELALAADIIVAAENTTFGQMEVARGIFPLGGATFRMCKAFGWHAAMRIILTGDTFDAEQGRRIGLVSEITAVGEQRACARELAERICRNAPLGVQAAIANADLARRDGDQAAIDQLLPAARALFGSRDAQEGIMSLVQKRPAKFVGE